MITLKKIDLFGQALIIGLGILMLFASKDRWVSLSLFFSLPIGCWQVLSALVHLGAKKNLVTIKERTGYMCAVVAFFIILVAMTEVETVIADIEITAWYFFLASTSLGIWYFTISFRELKIWQHRQFIQLR